jgi:hypothetical protein
MCMKRNPPFSDLLRISRRRRYLSSLARRERFVAVGDQSIQLELQLGQALFHRVNRALKLTHPGAAGNSVITIQLRVLRSHRNAVQPWRPLYVRVVTQLTAGIRMNARYAPSIVATVRKPRRPRSGLPHFTGSHTCPRSECQAAGFAQ